jgi:hypothetical protein
MENLSEKVFECTLAVEAHMVCDLLSQAGISARVDGEFMQSAMGEIPLGNVVKVRVDPTRAAEAREVIADWEKLQPVEPAAVPVTKTPRFRSLLWFIVGTTVGIAGAFIALRTPASYDSVDYDGDGNNDIKYEYKGRAIARMEFDRDDDGKVDARWIFDVNGMEREYDSDDDFDGRFEWRGDAEEGEVTRSMLDADGDGRPEQVEHFRHGVLVSIDYHQGSGGRIVKREFYKSGLLDTAEFDDDGDGVFERRVHYDAHAEPKL